MTTAAPLELDALEAAALAATPGPWWTQRVTEPQAVVNQGVWANEGECCATAVTLHVIMDEDEKFIAAANPAAVLELIRRVRAAEAVVSAISIDKDGDGFICREALAELGLCQS